jgi:hypothetical protein
MMSRLAAMLNPTGFGKSPRLKSTTSAKKHVRFSLREHWFRHKGHQLLVLNGLSCVSDLRVAAARIA